MNISNSVTKIRKSAFASCSGLTSITIPNGVKGIEFWAFANCDNLTSVTLPDSIMDIGDCAFANIELKEVFVPAGQKSRFSNMAGLKDFADIIQEVSAE